MLDFRPDEEQQMLATAVRRFADERARRVYRDAEEEGQLPGDVIEAGWSLGLLQTALPEQFGGLGDYSAVTAVIAAEELAWGDLSVALQVMAPGLVAMPVLLAGTDAQKEAHLPLFGEARLPAATAALTEPAIRFDPHALDTTANREGDFYVLNGRKSFVLGAATAETLLVYASEAGRTQAFFVPPDAVGVTVNEREKLMGVRSLPTYGLTLANVRIPTVNRLGGDAGIDFDRLLNHSRVALAALAVGVARAGYEYAREYAKNRVQFGEPIAHRQSIAFMLAEMAIDVDAARLMVWEAAWKIDRGEDITRDATVLKHYVDDMVLRVADSAVQTLGGHGYIREYPVELWLRNARGFAHFDGLAIL